ncbi:FAD-dependent monooxygenase [Verticiella sediminum]|uniref:FAD binding domain-containing protein n=1 Tax=Verticiella sediminum TaxID=1247510 RepID=UPI0014784792|nr:FAD-dependent monooxygenase [Verticiella sediminum]
MSAVVVGGSVGGLIAGIVLRRQGLDVRIYERNPTSIESRGAGMRVQPEMRQLFLSELDIDLGEVITCASGFRYIGRDDHSIAFSEEPIEFTSWTALYGMLLDRFGRERYHLGHELVDYRQDADTITALFSNGKAQVADILVFADGINSTGRTLMDPDARPRYAGYICWRGFVEADALSRQSRETLGDTLTATLLNPGHMHVYPIPPGDAGQSRRYNFVLYRRLARGTDFSHVMTDRSGVERPLSVPPGAVRDDVIQELRQFAGRHLPPSLSELVQRTPDPFIQSIIDIHAAVIADGRACLLGDAASGGRPHLGAATTKATVNAVALGRALFGSQDVRAAIRAWAPSQLRFGERMLSRNAMLGDRLLGDAISKPGDPELRPGVRDLIEEALAPVGAG